MGGFQGRSSLSLWHVTGESSDVPDYMLKTIELIIKASRGQFPDGTHIWPCLPTKHSIPMSSKRTVNGARYCTSSDYNETQAQAGFHLVDDVHPILRQRIAEFRGVGERSVVAAERDYQRMSEASRHSEKKDSYETTERELFKMHVLQAVHKGVGEDGVEANVVTTEIRMLSSFPGSCMLSLLEQMMEAMQELKLNVHRIWQQQKLVLQDQGKLSCEDMFTRTDALNAFKLCCEGCIPLAVHVYADTHQIREMDCFPVIDVRSKRQLTLYHTMLDEAASRSEFLYQRVQSWVTEKLVNPDFDLNVPSTDTRGWHCRVKSMRLVREAIENDLEDTRAGLAAQRLGSHEISIAIADERQKWQTWLDRQLQTGDRVYFMRLGWYPALTGTICRINPSYVPARDDRKRKDEMLGHEWEMPAMRTMSALVRLYFMVRLEERTRNGMQCFYSEEENYIVADLEYLRSHLNNQLPSQVLSLYQALEKEAATEMFKKQYSLSTRDVAVGELLGRNLQHPVYSHMAHNASTANLSDLAGVDFKTIRVSLQLHIENMATGELEQWAQAGEILRSLKKLGSVDWTDSMKDFLDSFRERKNVSFWPRVKDDRISPVLLLGGAFPIMYEIDAWSAINTHIDLNAQSKGVVDLFHYSITGIFLWSKMQPGWGYMSWMTDGGGSYYVLTSAGVQRVDNKTVGCGADVVKNATEDLNKGFPLHCCGDDIAKLHAHGLDMDTKYKESAMQMAKDTGTACERDAANRVIIDSNVKGKLGALSARTEIGKAATKKDEVGEFISNSENTLGHSGTDRGELVLWSTHMAGKPVQLVQIACSSVFVMCGNNLTGAAVTSSFTQTGRAKFVASPAALARGLIVCQKPGREDVARYLKRRKVTTANQLGDIGKSQAKPNLLSDNPRLCRTHKPYCWVRWLMRRGFPFFGKGFLTREICYPQHTMFGWKTVSHAVQVMTKDVRRMNLSDVEDWTRSFDGPCKFSVLLGLHLSRLGTAYTIQALLDPEPGPRVDLQMVFENMVLAYMRLPVDMVSVLSALYVYLNMCVLDFNLMILSCYLTHTMGVDQHCSLITIALVVAGFHKGLDDCQTLEYEHLCRFLVPVVTEGPQPMHPPACALMPRHWLAPTQEGNLLGGAHNPQACMDMLEKWCSFDDAGRVQQGLHNEICAQTSHLQRAAPGRSTYLMNRNAYTQNAGAAWVRNLQQRNSHQRQPTGREEVKSTIEAAAAVFGEQHSKSAVESRGKLFDFQDTAKFFQKAKDGARFPSNDRNKEKDPSVRFVPNEETAHWWSKTMENAGTLESLLLPFMQMCGLSLQTSRCDLLTKLLQPYLNTHHPTRRVCSDHAWKQAIFSSNDLNAKVHRSAFGMGIAPRMDHAAPHTPVGVDVNLGVDVLAFLLLQGLYSPPTHKTSDGHCTVVHHSNNQTAALGILELMLHTHVPLCEVPVTGSSCERREHLGAPAPPHTGRVFLHDASPIPLCAGTPAFLSFDERVHKDSTGLLYEVSVEDERTSVYVPGKVLSTGARDPGKWVLCTVHECGGERSQTIMCLRSVTTGVLPTALGDVLPFPVESVAHMQGVVQELLSVYKKACQLFEDNRLEFARTLRIFACSIEAHMLSYMWPLCLTHCAVRGEVPCLAWLHDGDEHRCFTFVLQIHAMQARIAGVAPTHHHSSHVGREYSLQPAESLPMFEELVGNVDMQSVLRSGLMYHNGTVSVRRPGATAAGIPLANMMFPVINYATVVTLQCASRILAAEKVHTRDTPETVAVAYVTLASVVLELMPYELEDEERGEWHMQNTDVLQSMREDDDLTVFGVDSMLVATSQLTSEAVPVHHERRWGPRCRFLLARRDGVYFLNSVAELRWTLEGQMDTEPLDGGSHLVCENSEFDKHDVLNNLFYPVRSDHSVYVLRENAASAAALTRLRQELDKAERNLQQTRDRMAELAGDAARTDELAQHAVVSAQRQAVVADVRERLAPLSDRPHIDELRFRGNGDGMDAMVVRELYEPFESNTGTTPVTAFIDMWDSGEFLHSGHYRVRVPLAPTVEQGVLQQNFDDLRMDFVAASRCMWVEGQELYLDVGRKEYAQIMCLFPGLRVADRSLHELLTSHDSAGHTVQFKCYYVLSHGARATHEQHVQAAADTSYWDTNEPKDVLQMGVQLLLPVHVCSVHSRGGVYHDKEDNQYMLQARLYLDGEMRVHPYPRPGHNSVCDVLEYRHEYARGAAENAAIQPGGDRVHARRQSQLQEAHHLGIQPGESAVWWALY